MGQDNNQQSGQNQMVDQQKQGDGGQQPLYVSGPQQKGLPGLNIKNIRKQMKEGGQNQMNGQLNNHSVHAGMQNAHHRKNNSTSVNSQAIMSGKHQIGGNNIKLVKPSELSLDLINPNNMRNMGIKGTHGLHN